MKLMVRRGRNVPFHPRMKCGPSGFCEHQWQLQMFKPGCYPGDLCPGPTVAEMVTRYLKELERTGHVQTGEPDAR